ncbi:MAG: TetR family transcriptional regulator [Bacillota bacterium]|nr:MAG: TetR family transcriptional regulator [Bacillota bacterium]
MEQFTTQGVEACEKVLTENVPFEEKMERVFELQRSLAALMTQEFLKSVVWSDPDNQNVSREIFQKKTLPFLQRFLDQGKREGIINPSITWEALMAYTSALASIKLQPDYLKSSEEHKQAIDRLFYYGLIGK